MCRTKLQLPYPVQRWVLEPAGIKTYSIWNLPILVQHDGQLSLHANVGRPVMWVDQLVLLPHKDVGMS